ncbi:MAG: ankyrin repeat domain-containing protein [Rickettsiaceae bacterium]|nr:ankyrin repeat domain-containing protein [Rickettsiaceae bacterium]
MITDNLAQKELDDALLIAVKRNDLGACINALENGANVNQTNANDITPLHLACYIGKAKTVKLLIERGANVNQPDKYGRTALYLACERDYTETVNLLIEKGANLNQADSRGRTPLYLACEKGCAKTADLLTNVGANVNQPDKYGRTPINLVCMYCYTEIAQLLIKHGAIGNLFEDIKQKIPDYAAAMEWCNNAFKDEPVYGCNLNEEAKNIINIIVANKFIDNDYTIEEIDQFFAHHNESQMLLDARCKIIKKVQRSDVYIHKWSDKIAKYLSEGCNFCVEDIGLAPKEKLANYVIEYLKSHGVSSCSEVAARALNLGDNDCATEIQKKIAVEIAGNASLESDFLELLSKPHLIARISEFNYLFKEILISASFEDPGNEQLTQDCLGSFGCY